MFRLPRGVQRVFISLLLCAPLTLLVQAQEASSASLQSRVDQVLSGMHRGRSIAQVAVSPDGKRLAWVQRGQIQISPIDKLDQGQPVNAGTLGEGCSESDIAWAPDSAAIAFLSDCGDPGGQLDVYISGLDGAMARRMTTLHGDVNAPEFSPDGKRIAFLYVEGATRPANATAAQDLPSGVIGEDKSDIQRVAAVAVDASPSTPATLITPASLHVYEFDWSPDSKSLAYIAADVPGENNWWVARLYTQPTQPIGSSAAGSAAMILNPSQVSGALHGMQIAVPRWSPDGKAIAFIGGLMSDQGVTGGDVWMVPAAGGAPVDLTPRQPSTASWITWGNDEALYVSDVAGGDCRLVRWQVAEPAGSTQNRMTGARTIFAVSGTVGDGRMQRSLSSTADRSLFVFASSSFNKPPEIFAARTDLQPSSPPSGLGAVRQLSHFNEGVKPSWGQSISLTWTNDKFHIQGWLMLPQNYDPAKKYPLIVEVHGGPASAMFSRWAVGGPLSPAVFSDLGYFILLPNPRGSFGQGEAFTEANRKDFGYGDLRDILAGVDTVLAKYPVDPHRIGITGWSYGGFMTMFAVTQTHRFRAAVAGAGISDWLSYYGENSIDQWMIPYFGASVYDDPAVYARSSAINFIKNASTPTLSVVGDRDGECPAPQSFEFWHALRDLHIPAELVVYPNEGHGLSDPAHRRDVLERAAEWFAKYMP
jgi:dipeptidyl aminopeptidase/acylaminoacyl peptidase